MWGIMQRDRVIIQEYCRGREAKGQLKPGISVPSNVALPMEMVVSGTAGYIKWNFYRGSFKQQQSFHPRTITSGGGGDHYTILSLQKYSNNATKVLTDDPLNCGRSCFPYPSQKYMNRICSREKPDVPLLHKELILWAGFTFSGFRCHLDRNSSPE